MNDEDKLAFDRRLFLRGLTLTSAGLVIPMGIISIPKPEPEWYISSDEKWSVGRWTAKTYSTKMAVPDDFVFKGGDRKNTWTFTNGVTWVFDVPREEW